MFHLAKGRHGIARWLSSKRSRLPGAPRYDYYLYSDESGYSTAEFDDSWPPPPSEGEYLLNPPDVKDKVIIEQVFRRRVIESLALRKALRCFPTLVREELTPYRQLRKLVIRKSGVDIGPLKIPLTLLESKEENEGEFDWMPDFNPDEEEQYYKSLAFKKHDFKSADNDDWPWHCEDLDEKFEAEMAPTYEQYQQALKEAAEEGDYPELDFAKLKDLDRPEEYEKLTTRIRAMTKPRRIRRVKPKSNPQPDEDEEGQAEAGGENDEKNNKK